MNGRIKVHLAVPQPKIIVASQMIGLEGGEGNFSIELNAIGGDALAWANFKGYPAKYFGATQAMIPDVLLPMLESGYQLVAEVLYAAFYESTGLPVDTGNPERPGCNLTAWPAGPLYGDFILAAGLIRHVPPGMNLLP